MKRDMDPVRRILLTAEAASDRLDETDFVYDAWSPQMVMYHLGLLISCDYLDGYIHVDKNRDPINAVITGVTWSGQDFLDAMRDDRVWVRAKKAVADSVGSTTFEVIKQACVLVATQAIKAQLGI